ncbi:MAG: PilW family protein [Betaproteobacteria bacterium]
MSAMHTSTSRRQGGFSIVELMIGIALGLVILAALTSFFVSTSANRHEIERTSRQIENGRFAIDSLRNEIRLAAFYAELATSAATFTTPDPCQVDLAQLGLSATPLQVPVAVFGYPADTAVPACITNRVPDTDVLVVRRFNTELVDTASANANQVYVQMSRCSTDSIATPWAVDYGGSANFTLKNTACSGPDSVYRFRVEAFYVRDYSSTPGDGIPTLVKVDLDNRALRVSPLVEGVQSLRISYGIDTNNDGAADVYSRCDTASACTVAQWNNVTTVRATVLAQNLEESRDYVDNKTYNLDGFPIGPLNDHRKRHVYQAAVSIPNRTGPREN